MRKIIAFLISTLILSGCFKNEPELPQYYSKQDLDVAIDSIICFSFHEGFDHFNLTCSNEHDEKRWYKTWYDNFQGVQFEYIGNDSVIEYPIYPHVASSYASIVCYGITNQDTTEYNLEVNYCGRNIYIPRSFTPDQDGINETWTPIVYTTSASGTYSIYWEIRTLEGVNVFESTIAGSPDFAWDGTYNGHNLPNGSYLFFIELTFQGEDPIEYTGWLEIAR